MRIWIIYDQKQYEKNAWFAERLVSCAGENADARLILTQALRYGLSGGHFTLQYEGRMVDPPDLAIMRSIDPFLSHYLEKAGVRVCNPAVISEICNDKRATYLLLAEHTPMMETFFAESAFFDPANVPADAYPLVVKSAGGHGGSEVFPVKNAEELSACLAKLTAPPIVLQKLCSPCRGDLRVYVLGGRIIGAALRSAEGFHSNLSLGGTAAAKTLSEKEQALVHRVINALPVCPDFVGVDFLYTDTGLIFNEIEDVVGTRMLYSCCGIDAAAEYVRFLLTSEPSAGALKSPAHH